MDTLHNRTLSFKLVKVLGEQIAAGEYPAGEAIDVTKLCIHSGVSRSVAREALKVLEAKGLIRVRPNTGTRVRPPAEWNLLDCDVIEWVQGTEVGDELAKAAAELAAVIERAELPDNLLYTQMKQMLIGYSA